MKKKRFISAVFSLLTFIALLPALAVTSAAAKDEGYSQDANGSVNGNYAKGWDGDYTKSLFYDTANIFSDDEKAELTEYVQEAAQELEMNIFVFAAGPSYYMSDEKTEIFADDSYDEYFGEDTDGVFFFMDFTGKKPAYDYISTSGKAVPYYQDDISDIFSSVNSYLPPSSVSEYSQFKDDISDAVITFISELKYYRGGDTAYYDDDSGKYFYYENNKLIITDKPPLKARLKVLIFAVPAGIIAAFIYFFSIKKAYKFKSSANPNVYISSEDTQFIRRDDRFIRTYTTKTKIESSSSSGGSGGGHSGGGGHGGGGSHR